MERSSHWKTDQKPLVLIYRKHMVEISPRIQRLIVRSFPYQPFNVQYRKGMEIPLADILSRVTPTPVEEDGIQLPIIAVNLITSNVPVSSTEIDLVCEETSKDPTLTLLKHYIHMGWPNDHRSLPQELHTFWNYREDLSMENGLVTKGVVIKELGLIFTELGRPFILRSDNGVPQLPEFLSSQPHHQQPTLSTKQWIC